MKRFIPLVLFAVPNSAHAAAPNDLTGASVSSANGMSDQMSLWLDGMDILGQENNNQLPANPATSQTLSMWFNKSYSTSVFAGHAYPPTTRFDLNYTTSFGVDYYTGTPGVYFRGTNSALEVTSNEIIGPNSDIFIVSTPTSYTSSSVIWNSEAVASNGSKRISITLPYGDNIVYWDYGTVSSPGRVQYNAGVSLNAAASWRFGITPGEQIISRNGAVVASASSTASYDFSVGQRRRLIGMGFAHGSTIGPYPGFQGTIHEVIAFTRKLSYTEAAILSTYLAGKYNLPDSNGLMNFSTGYRYHVGGIGGGSFAAVGTKVGTSAGLTIRNITGGSPSASDYTLFGVNSFVPATDLIFTGEQGYSGYARGRAARVWYVQQSAQTTYGTMTMTFNLTGTGLKGLSIPTVANGSRVALLRRPGTSGDWTIVATSTASSGSVSFSGITKATGYYTIALDNPPAPSIASTTSVALVSDPVNSTTNPKLIPGALADVTLSASNSGNGSPDNNSSVLQVPIPAGTKLYVGDLGAVNSGPVVFTPGSSGLSYTYTSLSSTTDRLDFSSDNASTWTYTPVLDVDKADAAVTHLRVRPTGTFAPSSSFTARWRIVIK